MISLNPTQQTNIAFEMQIDGVVQNIEKVYLCLESGQGYDIRIPAEYSNGQVNCLIPILENILDSGEHALTLEISIDGKTYQPLQESVLVESPVKINAKLTEEVKQVEPIREEPKFTASFTKAILKEINKSIN